jgi:nucleotide-binding universal stress UspA family protein
MYGHILIPADDSPAGITAVEQGVALAKSLGAKVTFLHVPQPFHTLTLSAEKIAETEDEHRQHEQERAELADRAQQNASAAGLEAQTIHAQQDHLGKAVTETAKMYGCDLVVMPAHEEHKLWGKTTLDSEIVALLTKSRLPVLVLH